MSTPSIEGASDGIVFSPSASSSLAFVRQKGIFQESDNNNIFLVSNVRESLSATDFYASADGTGSWDRSPDPIFWGKDCRTTYPETEDFARARLFSLPSDPALATSSPNPVFKEGVVSDVQ